MSTRRSWWIALVMSFVAITALAQSSVTASAQDQTANRTIATVPRPPFDTGTGKPVARSVFTNEARTVACRRVSGEKAWLECLLTRSNEIVRFGMAGGTVVRVPCKKPHAKDTCSKSFGRIEFAPATATDKLRFASARVVPLERLVELGRRTMPYPLCILDPNLGLSCSTAMDDSVGEQIYIGVADSIWNCPGYEYIDEQSAIPRGSARCRVVRP